MAAKVPRGAAKVPAKAPARAPARRVAPPAKAAAAAPAPPPPSKKKMTLSIALSSSQRKELERRFPLIDFQETPGSNTHQHGVLATERRIAEDEAYKFLKQRLAGHPGAPWIIDIGGNPTRHSAARRNDVHCCCPILDPADAVRTMTHVGRFCQHTAQNCNCQVPAAYMAIHSLYYLSLPDILALVNRATSHVLCATVHYFDAPIGHLGGGEATFERLGTRIQMSVGGNSHVYEHPNLDWLTGGYFSDGNTAMAWSEIRTMGDTHVLVFTTSPIFPHWRAPALTGSLAIGVQDTTNPLEIDLNPYKSASKWDPQLVAIWATVDNLYSYKDYFYLSLTSRQRVIVPKGAVAHIQTLMTGRKRDAANYQLAVQEARNQLSKMNLDPAMAAAALPYIASLGFTLALESETVVLSGIVATPRRLYDYKIYNDLLDFKDSWGYNIGWWVKAGAFIGFGAVAYQSGVFGFLRQIRLGFVPKFILWTAKTLLSPFISFVGRETPAQTQALTTKVIPVSHVDTVTRYASPFVVFSAASGLNYILEVLAKGVRYLRQKATELFLNLLYLYWYRPKKSYTDVCMKDYPVGPTQTGAKITESEVMACRPRECSRQVGFALVYTRPVVSRACAHNELVAVKVRGLPYIDVPDRVLDAQWLALRVFTQANFRLFFGRSFELEVIPFDKWVSRWPGTRQKEIRAADQAVRENPYLDMALLSKIEAFVKREHLPKTCIEGLIDYPPRLIQGSDDRYLAITGPWLYSMGKYLASRWNGKRKNRILYASGVTANALGEWFDRSVAYLSKFGKVVALEGDRRYFDGRIVIQAVDFKIWLYLHYQPPHAVRLGLYAQQEVKGTTRHGVKYQGKATTCSGRPDTSSGNTPMNVMPTVKTITLAERSVGMYEQEDPMKYACMSAGGDDDFILTVTTCNLDRVLERLLASEIPKYGFEPKVLYNDDPRMGTFYSGRFWPSDQGTIWGPKIGRVLSKSFYTMLPQLNRVQQLMWLKGVAMGFEKDCNHIPVLRAVIAAQLNFLYLVPEVTPIMDDHRPHSRVKAEATDDSWYMMYKLYGCTKEEVEKLEKRILSVRFLPCDLEHPLIERILRVDCEIGDKEATNYNHVETTGPHVVNPLSRDMEMTGNLEVNLNFMIQQLRLALLTDCWGQPNTRKVFRGDNTVFWRSPLIEEIAKHHCQVGGFALGFIVGMELFSAYLVKLRMKAKYGLDYKVEGYLPVLAMHCTTFLLPLWAAIPVHMVYNYLAVTGRIRSAYNMVTTMTGHFKYAIARLNYIWFGQGVPPAPAPVPGSRVPDLSYFT